jgi:hypothetical protein
MGENGAGAMAIELSSDQLDALTVAEKVRFLE